MIIIFCCHRLKINDAENLIKLYCAEKSSGESIRQCNFEY